MFAIYHQVVKWFPAVVGNVGIVPIKISTKHARLSKHTLSPSADVKSFITNGKKGKDRHIKSNPRYDSPLRILWKEGNLKKDYTQVLIKANNLLSNRALTCADGKTAMLVFQKTHYPQKCLEVFRYLHEIKCVLSEIHFNIAISCAAAKSDYKTAVKFLAEMKELGLKPNEISYTSTISACNTGKDWVVSLELMREMVDEGLYLDTVTYSSVMDSCAKGGKWELAIQLLREMELVGLVRNDITYNTAIHACAKAGEYKIAIELLREMDSAGVPTSTISYSSAIFGCAQVGEWRKAFELMREMDTVGIEKNVVTYGSAQFACRKGRQYEFEKQLEKEMCALGLRVTKKAFPSETTDVRDDAVKWQGVKVYSLEGIALYERKYDRISNISKK
eukprot:CFRG7813T1